MRIDRRESGMVLITVIMIILVMTVILLSVLSQSLSQTTTSVDKIDQVKSYELTQGAFWKMTMDRSAGVTTPTIAPAEPMDGKTYTPSYAGTGVQSANDPYHVTVTY